MGTYDGERSGVSKVITWILVALLAIAVLKLSFWVFGAALGLGVMLLFKVGPILLIGWLVIKLIRALRAPSRYDEP